MRVVYKYPLEKAQLQEVRMPSGAIILCVQIQGPNSVCVWALVDTTHPTIRRRFKICTTGEELAQDVKVMHYVGTIQSPISGDVFHFFSDRVEYPDVEPSTRAEDTI